jgi:hypothetical protein
MDFLGFGMPWPREGATPAILAALALKAVLAACGLVRKFSLTQVLCGLLALSPSTKPLMCSL